MRGDSNGGGIEWGHPNLRFLVPEDVDLTAQTWEWHAEDDGDELPVESLFEFMRAMAARHRAIHETLADCVQAHDVIAAVTTIRDVTLLQDGATFWASVDGRTQVQTADTLRAVRQLVAERLSPDHVALGWVDQLLAREPGAAEQTPTRRVSSIRPRKAETKSELVDRALVMAADEDPERVRLSLREWADFLSRVLPDPVSKDRVARSPVYKTYIGPAGKELKKGDRSAAAVWEDVRPAPPPQDEFEADVIRTDKWGLTERDEYLQMSPEERKADALARKFLKDSGAG